MAGIMTPNSILVRRGDSFDILMQFKDKKGKPLDIGGASVALTVQNSSGVFLYKIAGEIIDAAAGQARIKILPQHSKTEPGDYAANIEIVFRNGDVHTVFPQDMTANALFRISAEVSDDRS